MLFNMTHWPFKVHEATLWLQSRVSAAAHLMSLPQWSGGGLEAHLQGSHSVSSHSIHLTESSVNQQLVQRGSCQSRFRAVEHIRPIITTTTRGRLNNKCVKILTHQSGDHQVSACHTNKHTSLGLDEHHGVNSVCTWTVCVGTNRTTAVFYVTNMLAG